MPRKNRRLIYSGNGDAYYVSPSAIGSSELNVTTPEVFVTANPDDVARGRAQRWWREHGNVYGEKGLEQVSPEFDLIGLAPLVKPIVNTGLRSAGRMISKAVENHRYPLGRPQVPKDYITISPKTRTKIGDVEIDNPELAYRQGGKDMIEDFIDNGIVRGIDSRHIWGEAYANNPMFQHGSLFSKELSPGLLVSNGKTKAADVLSRPISEEAALKGGITFRIPDEPFTLANTQAYIFKPNYGYRRVLAEETPSLNWADATRTPQITAENAASITPEQWTAAQDAAIGRGDMAEAQRLRDLHFKVSAPNNTVVDNAGLPVHVYHGTSAKPFTIFDINASRVHDLGTYGKGFYFTPNKKTAINYGNGKHVFDSYLKLEKPYSGNMDVVDNVGNFRNLKELKNYYKQEGIPEKELNAVDWGNFDVADGVNAGDEIMVLRPNQIKLADAITYDDNGVRIPLGERDNFNINDIRYGLLPLGIGLTGYGLNQKRLGGRVRFEMGGNKNTKLSTKMQKAKKALEFVQSYYNSPGFKERFRKLPKVLKEFQESNRTENPYKSHVLVRHPLALTTIRNTPSIKDNASYRVKERDIQVGDINFPLKNVANDYDDAVAHEIGHAIDNSISVELKDDATGKVSKPTLNNRYSDIYDVFRHNYKYRRILNSLPVSSIDTFEADPNIGYDLAHDAMPEESYADSVKLRYELNKLGIYDSRKTNNPFTEKHIDLYKQAVNKDNRNRLFNNFNEEDIIWIMNNVAQLNNNSDDGRYMAAYGGKIKFGNGGKVKLLYAYS